MDTSTQSIEVRGREPRRRFRTAEEKRRIVEEALQPGASVARVARTHGVNANQWFGWRRLYLQGRLEPENRERPGLLAVRVVPGVREAARRSNASAACGTIQIELPKGTIRIAGIADPASLRTVLEYLAR
jgi:transposase